MPIRRLPPLLVNQIAAGEVIERPASVVKELMENSIDAGAQKIYITIEAGGCELISIADDGCGIAAEELPLAIAPHATSKLSAAEDLESIATLGFRGEALASIASVSRMTIVSRTNDSNAAAQIRAEGDVVSDVEPIAGPVGTTISVRNLFFNTPARRKFMRAPQTESGHVRDIVEALALAHPDIAVKLESDGRSILDLPAKQSPKRRALDILGGELENELLELDAESGSGLDRVKFWGMIGRPGIARATSRHIRMFVNGRRINDRTIHHALKEAYRGLIEPIRHPTAVIFIVLDPAAVDVNVHPTKAEVRFRRQAQVHGLIRSGVRQRLIDADLMPMVQFPAGNQPGVFDTKALQTSSAPNMEAAQHGGGGASGTVVPSWMDPTKRASHFSGGQRSTYPSRTPEFSAGNVRELNETDRQVDPARAFVEFFHRLDPKQKGFVYTEVKEALRQEPEFAEEMRNDAEFDTNRRGGASGFGDEKAEGLPKVQSAHRALQVHSSFIVTQDEQGLVIIDQHALHERVMFEKLKARMEKGPLESQRLLMPATLRVDRAQVEALDALKPLLSQLGIEAEPIGPAAIAIHCFTTLLFERKVDPVEFMTGLLDRAGDERFATNREAALHEVLDMMACKAAVKAGDKLTEDELAELISFRDTVERSSNCPHGRPTSLRLSIRDLEKQFGRS